MKTEVIQMNDHQLKQSVRNSSIVCSVSDIFSNYFISQNFKIKRSLDIIIASQKKSLVELWLPKLEDANNGNYIIFRLSVDLKTVQEFLIIMSNSNPIGNENDNEGNFYFKLVNQKKRNYQSNSDYPIFASFEELLNSAVDESSQQDICREKEQFIDENSEESVTIIKSLAI